MSERHEKTRRQEQRAVAEAVRANLADGMSIFDATRTALVDVAGLRDRDARATAQKLCEEALALREARAAEAELMATVPEILKMGPGDYKTQLEDDGSIRVVWFPADKTQQPVTHVVPREDADAFALKLREIQDFYGDSPRTLRQGLRGPDAAAEAIADSFRVQRSDGYGAPRR